jgi:RNA polymerase sigma factor (sigma-70 family)
VYTEQELLKGCKKGKRKYQEELYKHYFGFAMSVCLRYAPVREDAVEILNDSFLKVFDKIHLYDEDKPFKSWFRRILVNTSLDYYRSRKKYLFHVELNEAELDAEIPIDWESDLKTDVILKLFTQLPDLYRHIFNLYELEGYSHDEIAGMLSISPGTSRSHLSRAKKRIKELYAEHLKLDKR